MAANTSRSKTAPKVSPNKARQVVKAAKVVFAKRKTVRSGAWKKGGKEYSKVLGHFGLTSDSK